MQAQVGPQKGKYVLNAAGGLEYVPIDDPRPEHVNEAERMKQIDPATGLTYEQLARMGGGAPGGVPPPQTRGIQAASIANSGGPTAQAVGLSQPFDPQQPDAGVNPFQVMNAAIGGSAQPTGALGTSIGQPMWNPATGQFEEGHFTADGGWAWGPGTEPSTQRPIGGNAYINTLPEDPDEGGEGVTLPEGTIAGENQPGQWVGGPNDLPQPSQGGSPMIDPSTGQPYTPIPGGPGNPGGQMPTGGQGGQPISPGQQPQQPGGQQQPSQGWTPGTIPPSTGQGGPPPKFLTDLFSSFQGKHDEANKANLDRYNLLVNSLNDRLDIGLGMLEGAGTQAYADIDRDSQDMLARETQNLINRGMSNSTLHQDLARKVNEEAQQQKRRVGEDIRKERLGTYSQLSGDVLGAVERRNDVGPSTQDLIQLGLGLGNAGYNWTGQNAASGGGSPAGNSSSPWISGGMGTQGGLVANPSYMPGRQGNNSYMDWMYSVTQNPTSSNLGDSSNLLPPGTPIGNSVGSTVPGSRPRGSVYFTRR